MKGPLGLLGMAMNFGFTLGVSILMGYYAGRWLDGRFGTWPYITFFSVLLFIAAAFKVLIQQVLKETEGSPPKDKSDD